MEALRKLLGLVVPVLIALALVDAGLAHLAGASDVLEDVVDIQTPGTLYAKLDHIRVRARPSVLMVGDSVVYGRRMEEVGDAGWRGHTIPAHLQRLIDERLPGNHARVYNLGMNGALPADLEQVVRLATVLKPACIVSDVSLRAFSKDFSAPDARFSRAWLSTMRIDAGFALHTAAPDAPVNARLEAQLRDLATSWWRLYRLRDFAQWRAFDGEPSVLAKRFRTWLDQRWTGASPGLDPLDDVMLVLKAKNRHDSIDLAADNPQVGALKRTLDALAASNQPAIFFYATEERKRLAQLIEPARYARLQAELAALFAPYASKGITYVAPLDTLPSTVYIDYGHLTDPGNATVARAILDHGLGDLLARIVRK